MSAALLRALMWRGWRVAFVGALSSACSLSVSLDALSEGDAGGRGGSGGAATSTAGAGGGAEGGGSAGSGGGGVVLEGLIGYWPMDEGAGATVNDMSGRGHDAILFATPTWAEGWMGGGLSFAGTRGQRMEVPSLYGRAFPSSGTLSLWFRPSLEAIETASRGIFDNWDEMRSHLFVRRANGETSMVLQFALYSPATGYAFVAEIPVVNQEWQHLVFVWDTDAKLARASIDRTATVNTIVPPGWLPIDQEFVIGENFIGMIDEVRLYDRPLTEQEAAQL